jgi:hypothetical protein
VDAPWTWLTENPDVATALATVFTAFTALIALLLSAYGLWAQRRHDILSARPLPEVTVADYEDSLRIKLRNSGVGPLIVTAVKVIRSEVAKESVIAWMPTLPGSRVWNHFATDLAGRSLSPNGVIPLLELTRLEGENDFGKYRDLVRGSLRDLRIEVEYSDVYRTVFPPYSKTLAWFGRNLKDRA